MSIIINVNGRMVLDLRGHPTVEADVMLDDGTISRAIAQPVNRAGSREAF
jgi:enolase